MNKQGIFITFEGNDGSGKTTISKMVEAKLNELGLDCIYTREPGGNEIAEKIREIILNPSYTNMDERCEALLYAACRRQHLVDKIIPALNEGKIVICDRFIDSSLAYQGHARKIGMDKIQMINSFAIDDCMPIRTIFLKIDLEKASERMDQRGEKNRLDQEQQSFHELVKEGYEILCKNNPDRIKIIDASKSIDEVFEDAFKVVMELLHDKGYD